MKRLGVNIDHIATLRNARGENHPDPFFAAKFAKKLQEVKLYETAEFIRPCRTKSRFWPSRRPLGEVFFRPVGQKCSSHSATGAQDAPKEALHRPKGRPGGQAGRPKSRQEPILESKELLRPPQFPGAQDILAKH